MAKINAGNLEKNSSKILKLLENDGWKVSRVNGSHHILHKDGVSRPIVLPHPKKDLPIGTVRNIYRAAGWL